MELTITLVVTGLAAVLTVYASWKSGRPRKDKLSGNWISWPFVNVFAGAAVVFGIVHAANLMGIQTGNQRGSPYGP